MRFKVGPSELEMGGPYLDEMRDASGLLNNPAALRARLAEDGYLLLRGLQKRENVMEARRAMLEVVRDAGGLDSGAPPMEAVVAAGKEKGEYLPGMLQLAATVGRGPAIRGVAESPEIMGFFRVLLGGEPRTFDYKWLRIVGPGRNTGVHYDIVYMGEGTKNLYTVWCPFGDVSLELGGLMVCAGSHRWQQVKDTYGKMDVYRDRIQGTLSEDPVELVDKYGGQWKTTAYGAGDVIVFTMFTAHASLPNQTNRFRMSMDGRYQLASDPIDERWMGDSPFDEHGFLSGHGENIPIDVARKRWGI